jgi:acetylornithine deacetylase/succinyl-diaminopimelate desuccinylase-like protein
MTADPVTVPNSGPVIDVAIEALRTAFSTAPVFIRSGGTIPVVQLLHRWRVPTVLMGLALPNDRMHGFDERLYLPNLHRGITASIRFIDGLARRCASMQEPAL